MKKLICVSVFFAVCMRFAYTYAQQNETITIATYYPSPTGVYQTLRLNPTNEANATALVNPRPGQIYFDYDHKTFRYCNMSGSWVDLAGGGSYWSHNTTNTTHVSNNSWSVGIGTTDPNPAYKLHIVGAENGSVGRQVLAFFEADGGTRFNFYAACDTSADKAPEILTYRARGTMSGMSAVIANDTLFRLNATGYTGSASGYKTLAKIEFSADGDFNNTSAPGRISLFTTPSSSTVPLERVTIKNSGNVGIGTTDPQQSLDVNGAVRLQPITYTPANASGSIYYNNTLNTIVYADNTTKKWRSMISEAGTVQIPANVYNKTVTFRKTYTTAPIVIASTYRRANCTDFIVWVHVKNVTTTYADFIIGSMWKSTESEERYLSSGAADVEYIVIPR